MLKMNRKFIELWLFLSVLGLVLTPSLDTVKTDSSKDLLYAPRGNEKNKDSSVPPQEKTAGETSRDDPKASRSSSRELLDIEDDSGQVPERVYNLSPTNMEHLSCKPGQKAMFILHPQKKETYVGCFKDKLIRGYCPEFNARGVQPKYDAPCKITYTVCDDSYKAAEGYKFPKCFEIYGGISIPNEREQTPATTSLIEEPFVILLLVVVVVLVIVIIILALYINRECWSKKEPNKTIIPTTQIARGETDHILS